jgi:hypothetical protein
LPKALGCADWFTARVTTLGKLDKAMTSARATKYGAYIETIGGKMDKPPASRQRPWPAAQYALRVQVAPVKGRDPC